MDFAVGDERFFVVCVVFAEFHYSLDGGFYFGHETRAADVEGVGGTAVPVWVEFSNGGPNFTYLVHLVVFEVCVIYILPTDIAQNVFCGLNFDALFGFNRHDNVVYFFWTALPFCL